MKTLKDALLEADPCRHEGLSEDQRQLQLRRVLAAVATPDEDGYRAGWTPWAMTRWGIGIAAILVVVAALTLGTRLSPLFIGEVQAAVRFEIKLAEDKPAAGLEKAQVAGSNALVFLHKESLISNSDITSARLIVGTGPSDYGVSVEFKKEAGERLRAPTASQVGKHVAILIDGRVVAAPVIRTPISDSARLTGKFTKAQAQRIVNGIGVP